MQPNAPASPATSPTRVNRTTRASVTPDQASPELFSLAELDPQWVVDGERTGAGYQADDVVSSGAMREECPACAGVPLQLVLRYGRVIRTHLFCTHCTRCFDAVYPDGSSALMPLCAPIN